MELLPKLLTFILSQGYKVRGGELERSQAQAVDNASSGKGISNSLHLIRLAIDLHLFKDGKYLDTSEAHRPFGEFWKALNPLCAWGGDFSKPDGNHYSVSHNGVR